MSLPASPLRLLPTVATSVGWDSHPLKFRAFHGAQSKVGYGAGLNALRMWVKCKLAPVHLNLTNS